MTPEIIIPLIFGSVFCCAWGIGTYNKFVKYRNHIEEAWSGIDVALKRRANLIPNLIKVIEGYGQHEARIFQEKNQSVSEDTNNSRRIEEESRISKSLGGLLALAEAYPDLKASENFLSLQKSLDEVELEIQNARNRYNRYVSRLNTRVESFPSSLIANKFGFTRQEYLSLELATQREMPDVDFT